MVGWASDGGSHDRSLPSRVSASGKEDIDGHCDVVVERSHSVYCALLSM
jgi:hypothetical protein